MIAPLATAPDADTLGGEEPPTRRYYADLAGNALAANYLRVL